MGRFTLVLGIWLLFVGGVALYLEARDAGRPDAAMRTSSGPQTSGRDFNLELTLTFGAEPDPFALTSGDAANTAVTVRLNGALVAAMKDAVQPGQPWRAESIPGVVEGTNELLLSATPPMDLSSAQHAVRLRLFEGPQVVADETFWSEGGAPVSGTLRFDVRASKAEANDEPH